MPNDFVTTEYLATFAGLVAVVTIIVQFTKSIIKNRLPDWAVRLYTLVWAWLLLAFILYVRDTWTPEQIGLAFLNGILAALTATGAYEVIADPGAEKTKTGDKGGG